MRTLSPAVGGRALCLWTLAAVLGTVGCERGQPGEPDRLSVFAAASLTDAFAQIGQGFEAANPGVRARLTFAGSQVLRLQIEQGAGADVFASANPAHMDALVRSGLVQQRRVFAHNELVLIVPPDNPAGIETIADLPRAERLVIGTAGVPVGSYTRAMLRRADERFGAGFSVGVLAGVVSEENNVRLVRAKVELGEADAAVVYRTDAAGCDRVLAIPIPDALNVRADYQIGVLAASGRSELAGRFLSQLDSAAGRRVMASHGFVVDP